VRSAQGLTIMPTFLQRELAVSILVRPRIRRAFTNALFKYARKSIFWLAHGKPCYVGSAVGTPQRNCSRAARENAAKLVAIRNTNFEG
jgi:hypothetical protein